MAIAVGGTVMTSVVRQLTGCRAARPPPLGHDRWRSCAVPDQGADRAQSAGCCEHGPWRKLLTHLQEARLCRRLLGGHP